MPSTGMARKCSSCGHNGHNSRTCSGNSGGGGGLRLFGVQLHVGAAPLKKSFSMECLSSSASAYYAAAAVVAASNSSSSVSSSSSLVSVEETAEKMGHGYLSDGLMGRAQERKKGEFAYLFLEQFVGPVYLSDTLDSLGYRFWILSIF